uniref:G-protein coupled receptors family 1 profile domain-containing protein n=1 Tax=Plectus sambesii TaxID=2011161 RepID=A0A914WBU3_9BILA
MDTYDLIRPNTSERVYSYEDLAGVSSIDYGDVDALQMHPFVQIVALIVFCVYIFVLAFGIPANIYVLIRMRRLARNDIEKYTNGTGVGLLSMATADLSALVLISVQNLLLSMPLNANQLVKVTLCKVLLFSTHTVTSVSIWSWLLMSTLRYLAVKHPLFHLQLWQMPYRAVGLIVLFSSLTNVWLLVAVDHHNETGCTLNESTGDFNRFFLLIESVWSFCIPVIIIIYMDAMVLFCKTHKFISVNDSPHTSGAVRSRSKRAKSTLWKWLAIAFIDILLNTPENVYRIVMLLNAPQTTIDGLEYQLAAQIIAQVLYFSQFALNSVYLALFVFDRSTKPRTLSIRIHTHSELTAATSPSATVGRRRLHSNRELRYGSAEHVTLLPRRTNSCQLKVALTQL